MTSLQDPAVHTLEGGCFNTQVILVTLNYCAAEFAFYVKIFHVKRGGKPRDEIMHSVTKR